MADQNDRESVNMIDDLIKRYSTCNDYKQRLLLLSTVIQTLNSYSECNYDGKDHSLLPSDESISILLECYWNVERPKNVELHVIETVLMAILQIQEVSQSKNTLYKVINQIHPEEEWDLQFLLRLLRNQVFDENSDVIEVLLHRLVHMDSTVCRCHALERVLQFFSEEHEGFSSYNELMDPVIQVVISHFPHCTNPQYLYKMMYYTIIYVKKKAFPFLSLLKSKTEEEEEEKGNGVTILTRCWKILASVNLAMEMKDSSILCQLKVCCKCSERQSFMDILSVCDKTLLLYLSMVMKLGFYEREMNISSHLDVYTIMYDLLEYIDGDLEVITTFFSESIHILVVLLYLTKILHYDFENQVNNPHLYVILEFLLDLFDILSYMEEQKLNLYSVSTLIQRIQDVLQEYGVIE